MIAPSSYNLETFSASIFLLLLFLVPHKKKNTIFKWQPVVLILKVSLHQVSSDSSRSAQTGQTVQLLAARSEKRYNCLKSFDCKTNVFAHLKNILIAADAHFKDSLLALKNKLHIHFFWEIQIGVIISFTIKTYKRHIAIYTMVTMIGGQ